MLSQNFRYPHIEMTAIKAICYMAYILVVAYLGQCFNYRRHHTVGASKNILAKIINVTEFRAH